MIICVKPSRSGVYGITCGTVKIPGMSDFVYIGRAGSIESRRADYERIANGGSGKKVSSEMQDWLIKNKDFGFYLISANECDETRLIKDARKLGATLFNITKE